LDGGCPISDNDGFNFRATPIQIPSDLAAMGNDIIPFRIEPGMGVSAMIEQFDGTEPETSTSQDAARIALGLMLMTAGTSHLTFAREPFKAQVPPWVPIDPDTVVVQSGLAEISLGAALVFLPKQKALLGRIAGAFFTCVFPGNIAQYTHHRNAFGLNTDRKRFERLFFQPALVAWALWSTGALRRTPDKAELP
jgi:uncharacterized membrane protein